MVPKRQARTSDKTNDMKTTRARITMDSGLIKIIGLR